MNDLRNGLEKFEKILALKNKLPFFFFFNSQELLKILSSSKKKNKKKNLLKNIIIFFLNFLFLIISLINIFKLLFTSKKTLHLFIQINNSDHIYDPRSMHIFDILSPKETINFIILNDFKTGLKNLFKTPNAIYILQIKKFLQYFIFKKEKINLKKKFQEVLSFPEEDLNYYFDDALGSKKLSKFILIVLKLLKVDKIIAIDDPRNINELLYSAKLLKINTFGYQHARFNKYHVGLYQETFKTYFVWNSYFKNMAKKINKNYTEKNLVETGPIKSILKKNINNNEIKKIMILDEVYEDEISKHLINNIHIDQKSTFFLRLKPGKKKNINIPNIEIKVDDKKNYFLSLVENQIDLVIGTSSTSLIESWLIDVPSIMILSSDKYASHFYEDGLLELADSREKLNFLIDKYLKFDIKLKNERKSNIWGNNIEFKKDLLKKTLIC